MIGFKVRGDFFAWGNQNSDYTEAEEPFRRCLADRTGGFYVSTETVDQLVEALMKTLGCRLLF